MQAGIGAMEKDVLKIQVTIMKAQAGMTREPVSKGIKE